MGGGEILLACSLASPQTRPSITRASEYKSYFQRRKEGGEVHTLDDETTTTTTAPTTKTSADE